MRPVAELETALAQAQAALAAASVSPGDRATSRLGGAALRQHHNRTDAQLRRYIAAEDAVKRAETRLALARSREHRTPKTPAVMPEVNVGDYIDVGANRLLRVVKVNAKSVVTEGGNRWAAREIGEVVKP